MNLTTPRQFNIIPWTHGPLNRETIGGKRHYVTPDGKRLPSVTTVLDSFYGGKWAAWRKQIGEEKAKEILAKASSRGTKMHTICEKYLLGEDYKAKQMPDSLARFKTIQPIIDKNIDNIYCIEDALYSTSLGLAGSTDCIAEFDGKLSVIDFKTSSKWKSKEDIENYFIQGTAYALMFNEMTGLKPRQVVLIFATDEGESFYYVEQITPEYIRKLLDIIKLYKSKAVTC